ncbi:MAG TPA: murein L,D-transpeptidase catalytic domain family protein [Chitinophagaceae bacterium]|nr:murein L,D-transpeptidase catalytic domain family protein [Chitinophagaceae bacterium]
MKNNNTISYKKNHKGLYLAIFTLIITSLHLTTAFTRSNDFSKNHHTATAMLDPSRMEHLSNMSVSLYDSLHLDLMGLSQPAFDYARKGWEKLTDEGKLANQSLVTIVDFSQSSSHKRLYVLDMQNYRVVFNTWVAHGKNSGKEWARSFSNLSSSLKSSLGFYTTGDTYFGSNGYSLKLNGLEKGINDHAGNRAIVLHGADYVGQSVIDTRGYIGRSFGCPAVPLREASSIIDAIKGGSCLFIYSPDKKYVNRSAILNS